MKRGTKLLILLAILLVLMGATALTSWLTREEAQEEGPEVVIFSVETDTVTALSWTMNGETLSFTRADYLWTCDQNETVDLDDALMTAIAQELESVVAYRTIEDPGELEDYGLREPVCTITVNGDDALTLFLGNETGIGGQRYASIDDGKVYLVDEGLMDAFSYSLEDLEEVVEETEAE